MTLAIAIKQHAPAFVAAQKKYKESVIAVNMQMSAVSSSTLPAVLVIPKDWDKYQSLYLQAETAALKWVQAVLTRLLSTPPDVQGYNKVIVNTLTDAITQANTLATNPSNPTARAVLENDLKVIVGQLNNVSGFILGTVNHIQNFQNNLPVLAGQLQQIANLATNDVGVDKAQIEDLKKKVQAWQAEVDRLVAAIVLLGVLDVAAIGVALFFTFAAWPEGAVLWLCAAPVIAFATYYIALDGIKIAQLKAEMDGAASQIKDLTASVAVLHLLSQSYTDLANKTTAIKDDVQNVLAKWQAFAGSITGAVQQIQLAIKNEPSGNFAAIKTELNEALQEWNSVYQQAGDLTLNLVMKQASSSRLA